METFNDEKLFLKVYSVELDEIFQYPAALNLHVHRQMQQKV